jgi:hypothetical protein
LLNLSPLNPIQDAMKPIEPKQKPIAQDVAAYAIFLGNDDKMNCYHSRGHVLRD